MANKTNIETTELENDMMLESEVEAQPVKKTTKRTAQTVQFKPNDTIECRSVTSGELILIGAKSKLKYSWSDYGDTAYVEYQDLQALQSRKSGFLTKPRFIITDNALVEQWGAMLKPIYDKVNNDSIEDLFELQIDRFIRELKKLPAGLIDAVKTKAVQMIETGELYDIRKVRAIDELWGTDFVAMFMK